MRRTAEVQIKVQVFDNSDLTPLADALVEVHGNQSVLATARAGADGTVTVDFGYRAASWVIISAAKSNYVTNSVPWFSGRPPRKTSPLSRALVTPDMHLCLSSSFSSGSSSSASVRLSKFVPSGSSTRYADSVR